MHGIERIKSSPSKMFPSPFLDVMPQHINQNDVEWQQFFPAETQPVQIGVGYNNPCTTVVTVEPEGVFQRILHKHRNPRSHGLSRSISSVLSDASVTEGNSISEENVCVHISSPSCTIPMEIEGAASRNSLGNRIIHENGNIERTSSQDFKRELSVPDTLNNDTVSQLTEEYNCANYQLDRNETGNISQPESEEYSLPLPAIDNTHSH